MTGQGKPRASQFVFARLQERERLREFVEHGGLFFSDDVNHDGNGLHAKSL